MTAAPSKIRHRLLCSGSLLEPGADELQSLQFRQESNCGEVKTSICMFWHANLAIFMSYPSNTEYF